MISFLNINQFRQNLIPVTSSMTISGNNEFHIEGLFSEKIFGIINTKERREKYSYIDLQCQVIHPTAYNILTRLDRKIEKFISTEKTFKLDKMGLLMESEDPDAVTGISEFIKLFPSIKFRTETPVREKFVKVMRDEYQNGNLFVSIVPVMPVDFRPLTLDPETKEWTQDALNDVYQSILRKASQMKSAPEGPLYDLMNNSIQKAVLDHDKYIRSRVEKKQGLIRNQMLGKRIDFSGRAVITPEPSLNSDEMGIPFRMAVGLFEPFILYWLLNSGRFDKVVLSQEIHNYLGLDLSIENLLRVLKGVKDGDKLPPELYKIIYDATELAMRNRYIIAKRDPVLQTQSYMGMKAILHPGETLLISPLSCPAFNADFDGDTMAVFHPLTKESQDDIKTKMMNITSGSSSTAFSTELSKEMLVGIYSITKEPKVSGVEVNITDEDLDKIRDPYIIVRYRGQKTTAGRAIINSCFPQNYPFINKLITKKIIMVEIQNIYKVYGSEQVKQTMNCLKNQGFKWSTIIAPNMSLSDLQLPQEIYELKKKLAGSTPDQAQEIIDIATKLIQKHIEDTGLGDLSSSGASRGVGQLVQILFAKGVISDTQGNILPTMSSSFADGFTNVDYFNMTSGSRKGIIDRVINTADTGYMSRKLAYVTNSVEISQQIQDCKTPNYLAVRLTDSIMSRLTGRYISSNGRVELFDKTKFKSGDLISLRSPVFCRSKQICHVCYGELIKRHRSLFVGVLAAQVIGERGTQLIMKTFHSGGAVTITKKDILQDIIDNTTTE